MPEGIPDHLQRELAAVEADIRSAFRGVTREGGVSWSETSVIDDYGSDEERAQARARDVEPSWEALVDDPTWFIGDPGFCGDFVFLDAIGFRYYTAPALIRVLRDERGDDAVAMSLDPADGLRDRFNLFSPAQVDAILRFIRLMVALEAVRGEFSISLWRYAYQGWRERLPEIPALPPCSG